MKNSFVIHNRVIALFEVSFQAEKKYVKTNRQKMYCLGQIGCFYFRRVCIFADLGGPGHFATKRAFCVKR